MGVESIACDDAPAQRIFPNPARGAVRVLWPAEAIGLSVQDAAGREFHRVNGTQTGTVTLDVAAWPRGTVVLVWTDAEGAMCGSSRLVLE